MKDPIYESYKHSSSPITEGTLATQDFIAVNGKELDSRAIVYLSQIGTALYDLVLAMKNLKRVLRNEHYNGLKKAVKEDIEKGL